MTDRYKTEWNKIYHSDNIEFRMWQPQLFDSQVVRKWIVYNGTDNVLFSRRSKFISITIIRTFYPTKKNISNDFGLIFNSFGKKVKFLKSQKWKHNKTNA